MILCKKNTQKTLPQNPKSQCKPCPPPSLTPSFTHRNACGNMCRRRNDELRSMVFIQRQPFTLWTRYFEINNHLANAHYVRRLAPICTWRWSCDRHPPLVFATPIGAQLHNMWANLLCWRCLMAPIGPHTWGERRVVRWRIGVRKIGVYFEAKQTW
jgi:hypothetical protein